MYDMNFRFKRGQRVEFKPSEFVEYKMQGVVQASHKVGDQVWITPDRINGKFASKKQKNEICVTKKCVTRILSL